MTTLKIRLLAMSLLALPGAGLMAAGPDMKPGLWEMTNNVSSSNPQTQAAMDEVRRQLAAMAPEQRQAIQQMLEKNGVQADLGAGGALRTKVCMTREMIERKEVPMQEGDCTHKMTPLGANRMKVVFACTRPHASGEGEMTVDSPTRYHAQMRVHSQDQGNQAVDMDINGRWLAADCGNVRPIRN